MSDRFVWRDEVAGVVDDYARGVLHLVVAVMKDKMTRGPASNLSAENQVSSRQPENTV